MSEAFEPTQCNTIECKYSIIYFDDKEGAWLQATKHKFISEDAAEIYVRRGLAYSSVSTLRRAIKNGNWQVVELEKN